jgi:hypothetical protein
MSDDMNLDSVILPSSLNEGLLYLEFTEIPVMISLCWIFFKHKTKINGNVFAAVFKKRFKKSYYILNVLRLFVIDLTLVHFTYVFNVFLI